MSKLIFPPFRFILSLLLLSLPFTVYAQADELTLNFSRDFGYSSGTGDIQGTFSMKVTGPADLERVVFLIDGQSIGEDSEAPFRIQFNTDSFELGQHTLSAIGYTTAGKELKSKEYQRKFISANEGWQSAMKIVGPILLLVFGISALSFIFPLILKGGKGNTIPLGSPRNYGFAGGTICPKCRRPFAMHWLSPNVLIGKLDRCPHCGKWSVVTRASQSALKAAEAAELEQVAETPQVLGETEEEKLNKELDDSRFQS